MLGFWKLPFKFCKILYQMFLSAIRSLWKHGTLRQISFVSGTTSASDCWIALRALMDKRHLQHGLHIRRFERALANYLDVSYAYSFFGGRISLSAILYALDIGKGDEVILPGYTCVVVPNALIYRGIKPVYVDIEPLTFNLDPTKIEEKITERTRAIVIQYTYGLVPEIPPLLEVARKHDLKVIEDCAHALGAEYDGRKVGTFGDAAFFSTEQSKVISTGMGGLAVTNDPEIAARLREFQRQCSSPESQEIRRRLWQYIAYHLIFHPDHAWWARCLVSPVLWKLNFFIPSTTTAECQGEKPVNYAKRMPNAMARLGLSQFTKIDKLNRHRIKIAQRYELALEEIGIPSAHVLPNTQPVFVRYPVWVRDKEQKEQIVNLSRENHIDIGVWFSSTIHPKGSALERAHYKAGQCLEGEKAAEFVLNLPTHSKISETDVARIIGVFEPSVHQENGRGQ